MIKLNFEVSSQKPECKSIRIDALAIQETGRDQQPARMVGQISLDLRNKSMEARFTSSVLGLRMWGVK